MLLNRKENSLQKKFFIDIIVHITSKIASIGLVIFAIGHNVSLVLGDSIQNMSKIYYKTRQKRKVFLSHMCIKGIKVIVIQ
jgi:hypothetical protein